MIVTQAFAPLLGTDRGLKGNPGRIVNIGSVGGRIFNRFLASYVASKFALEVVGEFEARAPAVRRRRHHLAPGAVATPIWAKAEQVDVLPYRNTPYAAPLDRLRNYMLMLGKQGLPPERIGEAVRHALTAAKPKVRYTVTPTPVQNWLATNLPKRVVDRMVGSRLGLVPKKG